MGCKSNIRTKCVFWFNKKSKWHINMNIKCFVLYVNIHVTVINTTRKRKLCLLTQLTLIEASIAMAEKDVSKARQ